MPELRIRRLRRYTRPARLRKHISEVEAIADAKAEAGVALEESVARKDPMLIILIIVLILVFAGGGGYYGYGRWGSGGGAGIGLGTVLVILLILYLLGYLRHLHL